MEDHFNGGRSVSSSGADQDTDGHGANMTGKLEKADIEFGMSFKARSEGL